MAEGRTQGQGLRSRYVVLLVAILLLGLPLAAWLDLRALNERILRDQATEIGHLIDDIRGYYATNVVDRVMQAHGTVVAAHNYRDIPGAIPIPATLSIELGQVISVQGGAVRYRFVSDLPFKGRAPHRLDAFEKSAMDELRQDPQAPIVRTSGSILENQVRIAAPIIMGATCVACHNTDPDSPKRDWKVGDVRGIQEVEVRQTIATNIFAFKYLFGYFLLAAAIGATFIVGQRRQAALISGINGELTETNNFLAAISMKLAKYLSPQLYKSIFSGERDVAIATERKKLTIFFSDIKDFTATTERLQPEELAALLNEYLTEMSAFALEYGGTIGKFIGDAMLVFFGDPESRGVTEDARACLRMAVAMQHRLARLDIEWRARGVEHPFRVRMGINTGYCNVGNFGSAERMEYTIIGAEANLAARLQAIAEPGGIVMSYETHAHVRDLVQVRALTPIVMKGLSREVAPYAVVGVLGDLSQGHIISERATGLHLFLDVENLDPTATARTRAALEEALQALASR